MVDQKYMQAIHNVWLAHIYIYVYKKRILAGDSKGVHHVANRAERNVAPSDPTSLPLYPSFSLSLMRSAFVYYEYGGDVCLPHDIKTLNRSY